MSKNDELHPATGTKRLVFLIVGYLSLGLGMIGIVVPLLPTTPLVLLACACFLRSSQRMYAWVHNNKVLGTYLLNYEKKQMKKRDKIITLCILWISISISVWMIPLLWVKILVVCIAVAVTCHISSLTSV